MSQSEPSGKSLILIGRFDLLFGSTGRSVDLLHWDPSMSSPALLRVVVDHSIGTHLRIGGWWFHKILSSPPLYQEDKTEDVGRDGEGSRNLDVAIVVARRSAVASGRWSPGSTMGPRYKRLASRNRSRRLTVGDDGGQTPPWAGRGWI